MRLAVLGGTPLIHPIDVILKRRAVRKLLHAINKLHVIGIKQTSDTLRDGTPVIYHDSENKWTQKRALANSRMSVIGIRNNEASVLRVPIAACHGGN